MVTLARLQFQQLLTGRKIFLLVIFFLLPVAMTATLAVNDAFQGKSLEAVAVYLFVLHPVAFSILLSLVYGSSVIGGDVDDQTIVYLFTRAKSRWQVLIGKYLAVILLLVVCGVVDFLISWILLGCPGGASIAFAFVLATVAAVVGYTAIFVALGVLFAKHSMVVGLLYVFVLEISLSFVPAVVNKLTVTHHLRSIVVRLGGFDVESLDAKIIRMVGDSSVPEAFLALALVTSLALGVAAVMVTRREYSGARQT